MLPKYVVIKNGVVIRETPSELRSLFANEAVDFLCPNNNIGEFVYLCIGGQIEPDRPTTFLKKEKS